MTKQAKPDTICLLKKDDIGNREEFPDIVQLRSDLMLGLGRRFQLAYDMDHGLITQYATSDRFVIHVTDQSKEQVPEACSRILLRPRRKYLVQGGIRSLHIYTPDDILGGGDNTQEASRMYIRQLGPQNRLARFLLTKSQLAPYEQLDDLELDLTLDYYVPDSLAFAPEQELQVVQLLNGIVNEEQPDSYLLKSQNIRV